MCYPEAPTSIIQTLADQAKVGSMVEGWMQYLYAWPIHP